MVMVDSIYKYLEPYCDCYPIWTVHKKEFNIYPVSVSPNIMDMTADISFRICSSKYETINLNTYKIISKKARDFLFNHFKGIIEYNETFSLIDKYIDINLKIMEFYNDNTN